MLDLFFIRKEILNKGYYVFKNFASSDECILLRDIIEKKLKHCPEYNERINSDTMPDYSHKRSHDKNLRTIRYYSFYHNHHKWSNIENKILKKGLDIRDKIEEEWVQNLEYKKIKFSLQNYNIFTKYIESTGMLKPHRDYPKKLVFPLLQFNLILSEQKKDFTSGEFVFEDYKRNTLKIHNDLNMSIGDALLFDKYLLHSVELTHSGLTGIGRWSVLVGARADKISFFKEKKIRLKYKLKNLLKQVD
jgi:hypothetical protein